MAATKRQSDFFRLEEISRHIRLEADNRADKAANSARKAAEKEQLDVIRQWYGGKTLYCYDESHRDRFARGNEEHNAIGLTFKECVDKARAYIFSHHGEERWLRIERELASTPPEALPSPDPEQRLVFEAGGYWYCFFCIDGDKFCDLVARRIAEERKDNANRANQSREGIDVEFH